MRTLIYAGSCWNNVTGEHSTLAHLRASAAEILYRSRVGYQDPTGTTSLFMPWHRYMVGNVLDHVPEGSRIYQAPGFPNSIEDCLRELQDHSVQYGLDLVWLVCHAHTAPHLQTILKRPVFRELRRRDVQLIVAEDYLLSYDPGVWKKELAGWI